MSVFLGAFNKAIADELQFKLTQRTAPRRLSEQQNDIVTAALDPKGGSINIIARAGCGKSTTLLELARKVDTRAYAATFHSIGLRIWRESGHRSEIDGMKTKSLARAVFPYDKKLASLLGAAVSFAKQAAFGVRGAPGGTEADWAGLIDYYQLDDEIPAGISAERFITECEKVYRKSLAMCTDENSIIDFDDMLLAPMYFHGNKPPAVQYDWVFTDEAQDTNPIRRMLAKWILRPGGRMISCGDPRQAIYHFCGASSNAMDLIKEEMSAVELPLNVTYRCPKAIVTMAQTWVPDFTAHESAPEGVIRTIDHSDFWLENLSVDDVILCRNTRPLVGIAMRLRQAGISCVVEGQSGQALIALITKWGDITIESFLLRMREWQDQQESKWLAKERPDKLEAVNDRCGTVRQLTEGMNIESDTTKRLVARVELLFGDDNRDNVLRLCTIHRAKGREWERVYLIGRTTYQPSPYASTDEELRQEENLMYVAITRVKHELVEVTVPRKGRKDDPEWWEV